MSRNSDLSPIFHFLDTLEGDPMDKDPVVGSLELLVELVDIVVDTFEGDRSGNNSRNSIFFYFCNTTAS